MQHSVPEEDKLTMSQASMLKARFEGLRDHIVDHPALKETRLHVGSDPPPIKQGQVRHRDYGMNE